MINFNFLQTFWTIHTTHKNPKYFADLEKFDPSRFEGGGPAPYTFVPFGGGPRMCPGKEYARLEILVFMYNMVTKFKLQKSIPDEKIVFHQSPTPMNADKGKGYPVQCSGSCLLCYRINVYYLLTNEYS
ncbi:hypothetical protein LguiB_018129 [Lonicera macranthoides]